MGLNFRLGLNTFLEKFKNNNLSILSIGCGREISIIEDEMLAFLQLNSNTKINYLGVDEKLPQASNIAAQITQNLQEYPGFNHCELLEMDINIIESLSQKRFDLVLLRHPQFFEHYQETTKQIFRITIPALLKQEGYLIVSLYTDVERVFLGDSPDKTTLDGILLKALYKDIQKLENNAQNASRSITIAGFSGVDDRYMYCLTNKLNTLDTAAVPFEIQDADQRTFNYTLQCAKAIGARFDEPTKKVYLWQEYAASLIAQLKLPLVADTPNAIGYPARLGFFKVSDLTHQHVIEEMKKLNSQDPDYLTLYNSLLQQNYNRALRQACTAKSDLAKQVVDLLLNYGSQLQLSPLEKNSNNQSAIDLAIKHKNSTFQAQLETFVEKMDCFISPHSNQPRSP